MGLPEVFYMLQIGLFGLQRGLSKIIINDVPSYHYDEAKGRVGYMSHE